MQKNLIFIISLLMATTLLSTGCDPHRIDVQQGNRIKPEVFSQLKTGMTRSQVVFLLGTPLLQDPFHNNRWDYIYYMKPGNDKAKKSRLTLHFEGDILAVIDDSGYAPEMHGDDSVRDFNTDDPPPELSNTPQYPVE